MSEFLQRLVFYSENKIKELGLPLGREIQDIAVSGQRDFPAAGITGVLIYNEQIFVGVLEGDRRRLSAALLRLARDRRNANFTVMDFSAVASRSFLEWSTVYAGHSDEIDRLYLRHGIAIGLDPSRMTAQQVVPLAEALVALHTLAPMPGTAREGRDGPTVFHVTNSLAGATGLSAPTASATGAPVS